MANCYEGPFLPHKLFWVALRTFWSGWTKPLILVTPRTVVNWHRAGFRLYWTWVSRVSQVGGRKRVSKEVRALQHHRASNGSLDLSRRPPSRVPAGKNRRVKARKSSEDAAL